MAVLATTALLIAASGQPRTQQPSGHDRVLWIQHLMQEVVPELKHCKLKLEFSTDLDRDWDGYAVVELKLWEVSGNRATTVLEGLLNLAYGLESLHLKGPYTRNDAFDEARAEVRSHPEWTDRDVAAALQRRGALFPSDRKEEFTQHLQPKRFARVFGPLKRVEIDFVPWRLDGGERRAGEDPLLLWRVEFDTEGRQGRVERRFLTFEPMQGRFVFLSRAQPDVP